MKYNALEVIGSAATRRSGLAAKSVTYWTCRCDCGRIVEVRRGHVVSGATKSCGCHRSTSAAQRATRHGHAARGRHSTTYDIWTGILQRCRNPNYPHWELYGGRGVTVCDRWLKFENFLADMGERPAGLSIDRIDNDRGYEPANCRWATRSQQNKNRRPFPVGEPKGSVTG